MPIQEYVTFRTDRQLFGLPIASVREVLKSDKITPIALAPFWIEGVINLRGRIVTAISLRKRLGLATEVAKPQFNVSVVSDFRGESYLILVDSVDEVLTLNEETIESASLILDTGWQTVTTGIYQLACELLIILDIERLLDFEFSCAA